MKNEAIENALYHGLSPDAALLAVAPARSLAPYLDDLVAVQDDIARAIEKARSVMERLAA